MMTTTCLTINKQYNEMEEMANLKIITNHNKSLSKQNKTEFDGIIYSSFDIHSMEQYRIFYKNFYKQKFYQILFFTHRNYHDDDDDNKFFVVDSMSGWFIFFQSKNKVQPYSHTIIDYKTTVLKY